MRKIQLTLPAPCHENWHNMSISQKGRFCNSCKKEVIDFTNMTDQQIISTVSQSSNICGRVEDTQLNRNLLMPSGGGMLRHAWKFLLPTFFFSKNISAQGKLPGVDTLESRAAARNFSSPHQYIYGKVRAIAIEKKYVLTGRLTDSTNGEPIPHATILIGSKTYSSDSNGDFIISGITIDPMVVLVFSEVGYEKKLVPLSIPVSGFQMQMSLQIKPNVSILNPVLVTSYDGVQRRVLSGEMVSWRTLPNRDSVVKKVTTLFLGNPLQLYPNPVSAGTSLTIATRQLKPGNYIIQLIAINGKIIVSKQLAVSSKSITESITTTGVLPGNYIVVIADTKQTIVQRAKLVVL